jgi:hypothetical protein
VLYQVICLQNTPPETIEEQQCCLEAKTSCWRTKVKRRASSAPTAAKAEASASATT